MMAHIPHKHLVDSSISHNRASNAEGREHFHLWTIPRTVLWAAQTHSYGNNGQEAKPQPCARRYLACAVAGTGESSPFVGDPRLPVYFPHVPWGTSRRVNGVICTCFQQVAWSGIGAGEQEGSP